jgi:DNA-binding transcriptional ArsR family regulator
MSGRFSRLPRAAISDRRLSGDDLRALAAVCVYVDREGRCWVSTDRLADDLGIHRRSVQRHLKTLKSLGYVTKDGTFETGDGRRATAHKVTYPETTPDVALINSKTTPGVVLDDEYEEDQATPGVVDGQGKTTPDDIENDTFRHSERHMGVAIDNSPSEQPTLNSPLESAQFTQRQAAAALEGFAQEERHPHPSEAAFLATYGLLTIDIPEAELAAWIAEMVEEYGPGMVETALSHVAKSSTYSIDALNKAHWAALESGD